MTDEPKNGTDLQAKPEPVPEPLTLDEARMSVARSVAASLQRTVVAETARIKAMPVQCGVEYDNATLMEQAARELIATLTHAADQFDRPRILRSPRSRKIFRG